MPFIQAPQALAALTSDGSLEGYVGVADATPFWPGAKVWLSATLEASKEYMITDIDGNWIGLRLVEARDGGQSYGRTPVTEYLVADGAQINQESQVVPAEIPLNKVIR